jgi:hypothetical protein
MIRTRIIVWFRNLYILSSDGRHWEKILANTLLLLLTPSFRSIRAVIKLIELAGR